MVGPEEPRESVEKFRKMVERDPVSYVAQEMIDFSTHLLCETEGGGGGGFVLRDSFADYRMLALAPDPEDLEVVEVVPGSLSRVAAQGKHVVNISSSGKTKNTRVSR